LRDEASLRAISEPVSAPTVSSIEETYKGRDVEGLIDIHFYRRVGYGLAVFFARLGFTPIAVTLLGGVFIIIPASRST
jgi:hypothetical protein